MTIRLDTTTALGSPTTALRTRRARRSRRTSGRETDEILRQVAATVLKLRAAHRWTQRDLGARSDVAQSEVSDVEHARLPDLPIGTAVRLLTALGARVTLKVDAPFIGRQSEQRDAAHARSIAYVASRLAAAGWLTRTEVEVIAPRSRGWIDVLAFHPGMRCLLLIEVKTELRDLGAIERQLGWYEREAWAVARRLGWRPSTLLPCLVVLDTASNADRIRANRLTFEVDFPGRADELEWALQGTLTAMPSGRDSHLRERVIAMVDPRSRRAHWLRRTGIDGRRGRPPYLDYADFMRQAVPRRARVASTRSAIEGFDTRGRGPRG